MAQIPAPVGDSEAATTIDALPDDVLVRIFSALSFDQMRCVLPLVNRRWHAVTSGPSRLFRDIELDLLQGPLLQGQAAVRAQQWVAPRAASLDRLSLRLSSREESGFAAGVLQALAGAATEPQLRVLVLDCEEASNEAASAFLAALTSATRVASRLEYLSLHIPGPLLHTQRLQLPQLRAICIDFREPPAAANCLPDGLPAFLLACHRLEQLIIINAGDIALRSLPEGLSQLQRLKGLRLGYSGSITEPTASLAALTGLEALEIVTGHAWANDGLSPTLAALTRLTEVRLSCMTLPVTLGALSKLRFLRLDSIITFGPDNEAEFAQLLDGLQLESLELRFSSLLTLPAAIWRHTSLRSLALTACRLRELPTGPYLQQLIHLDISDNLFREVPVAALAAPQLRTLVMLDGEQPLEVRALAGTPALATVVAELNAKLAEEAGDGDSDETDSGPEDEAVEL